MSLTDLPDQIQRTDAEHEQWQAGMDDLARACGYADLLDFEERHGPREDDEDEPDDRTEAEFRWDRDEDYLMERQYIESHGGEW